MSLDELASALENCPENEAVPGDQEYRLRLSRFWMGTQEEAKGGRQYFMASVDFPEIATAKEMSIFVGFKPITGGDAAMTPEERKANVKALQDLKTFLSAWNIPFSLLGEMDESQERPSLKAVEGLEVRAVVGLKDSKRNAGEKENFVKQYLA